MSEFHDTYSTNNIFRMNLIILQKKISYVIKDNNKDHENYIIH